MTDNQIIIDDYFRKIVDINGKIVDYEIKNSEISKLVQKIEKYNSYIELKEQECKELKKCLLQVQNASISLNKQLDQLKEKNEKISKGYAELTDIVSPYIDDFTGYNEKLGGFDIVLCIKELLQQIDQIKVENEILKEKLVISSNSDKKTLKIIQTLAEIKDIAENVQSFVGRIDIEDDVCEQMEQILQKISEVIK